MDLKHLLSPVQKDQGAPQTKNRQEASERPGWPHTSGDPSHPSHPSHPPQHHYYPPGYPPGYPQPYPPPPQQHEQRFDQYHPHPYEGHPIH
ncbi:hypothetical protein BGZ52_009125, partial [Haplosporangium bisporale]